VFIDPVSTGYSRQVPGEKAKDFHGFKKDYESVGDFIRLWTTRNNRWTAPKFLIGESYGTTRAAALSGYLQESYGMYLNGIMLISSILNFQTARFVAGNDLPFITFLPTYCATAHYHKKLNEELSKDLVKTLDEVRAFAANEYTLALMKGDRLDGEEKENITNKLVKYTGLTRDYIVRTNFRINIYKFIKELLRDQRKTVGRLDSRFTGIDRDATGAQSSYDPSYSIILGPYSSTLQDYVRRELKFESDLKYHILAGLYENWSYGEHENQYVNVAETLRDSMTKNPFLKVFIANGYYDFATPFFATEYTFDHLSLDPSLRDNISMAYYEAGHMMYLHEDSLVKQKKDLVDFINSAL
jgi:carboxypeptidase C (cathepsin A)